MSDIELPQSSTPLPPVGASPETSAAIKGQPHWKKALAGIVPFTAQRAAFGLIVVLAIIYLTFIGTDMAQGDDLSQAVREAVPDTVNYVTRALQGDLGVSTAGSDTLIPVPVSEVLQERFIRSMGLMGISLGLASLVGILLGIWAARGRSRRSLGVIIATIIGVSVPSFFAAFLLQWAATTYTRVVGRSLIPVGGFGWDGHLILPVLVLAARPIAQITRITFVSVRAALQEDYVRTAHGKGLHRIRVILDLPALGKVERETQARMQELALEDDAVIRIVADDEPIEAAHE
ncbi:MAG: ABC transporter permease, partial [Anaerolineales bacterium]|nr:ABC transporter permease [Anaerolineales bacterium]